MPSINGIVRKNQLIEPCKLIKISDLLDAESVVCWKATCKGNNPKDTGVGK